MKISETILKPELLAPAGSLESFFAAIDSGADAVYAGLQVFSARARAKNFTINQLERMLAYAHGENRQVYVTLNTLVKERELPQLLDTLASLAAMRVDGVILQDMAVARLVRNHFPQIPLHASTQLTIHNIPGVMALEKLGFRRAVLARELAVDEIAAIASATGVEIECFVHGALCFSVSGQCFFSSLLGGHSGNRGRCAQPCRRSYNHRGKEGHYFSANDLSAIEMLPELIKAGVKSLKIEGRMKSAEYVATVVAAYRIVLDAPPDAVNERLAEAKGMLKYSFGRAPTKGFLASHQPDNIVNPWQKGGTGRFIGQIKSCRGKNITFETRDELFVGDRVRVQPKSDMAGQGWTVRILSVNGKKCMQAAAGAIVEVETPFSCSSGDSIYKVSSREAYTLSESACQRRLESARRVRQPFSLAASFEGGTMRLVADLAGKSYEFNYELGELETARSSDMHAVLFSQFARTGDAPFHLESLSAPDFPPVLIPMSKFKEIRRSFYSQLFERSTASWREQLSLSNDEARRELRSGWGGEIGRDRDREKDRDVFVVVVDQLKDWRFPLQNGAAFTLIPLNRSVIHQFAANLPRMRGLEDKIIWQLPFMLFDRDIPLYSDSLKTLARAGFRRFEAANLSHFELLSHFTGAVLSTSYRCFSLNSQALAFWHDMGAQTATLYLEDDSLNIADLLGSGVPIEKRILLFAPIPVMTTKIRMKDVHGNIPLRSDRGETYSVATHDGLQTITSSLRFSLAARRSELLRMGSASSVVDLSCEPRERWSEIISACKLGRALPGTTEFNFATELV